MRGAGPALGIDKQGSSLGRPIDGSLAQESKCLFTEKNTEMFSSMLLLEEYTRFKKKTG